MAPLAFNLELLINTEKVLRCHVDSLGEGRLLDRIRHLVRCRRELLLHLHLVVDLLRGAAQVRALRIYHENAVFIQMARAG